MLSCCFRRLLVQLYACTEETTFISNSTWKSEKIPKPKLNPRLMIRNPPRSVPFRSQVKSTPHVHVHANATQARAYVQTGIEQVKDRNASQNVHDKERGSCKESERRKRKWGRNRERIRGTGKRHFRGDRQRILRAKSLVSSPRAHVRTIAALESDAAIERDIISNHLLFSIFFSWPCQASPDPRLQIWVTPRTTSRSMCFAFLLAESLMI